MVSEILNPILFSYLLAVAMLQFSQDANNNVSIAPITSYG